MVQVKRKNRLYCSYSSVAVEIMIETTLIKEAFNGGLAYSSRDFSPLPSWLLTLLKQNPFLHVKSSMELGV